MELPRVVEGAEWQAALDAIRASEKALTEAHDRLAAERRRMPMTEVNAGYVFLGERGEARWADLFAGRSQLLLYHFMFAPGAGGWPDAGCPGCSMFIDQVGHRAHLHARDTSFAMVSAGPLPSLLAYRRRMGWDDLPWYSSAGSTFNRDFGMTTDDYETFGLSVFVRDGERVFRTYTTAGRGVESLGPLWTLLDLTPMGRQEEWEDTPAGRARQEPPYQWWRRHDEY